jgi:DNA-directed RNA polymerase alpha subunit/DNA-directed RNA polymerase subunit L
MAASMAAPAAAPARKQAISFNNLRQEEGLTKFTLSPIHVSYVNTLRRIILTGVETVAIRSDMITTGDRAGTTTDVVVKQNDTPMTNEMLADRIGLLPIHVTEPLKWNKDEYEFILNVEGSKDESTYVKAGDFKIIKKSSISPEEKVEVEREIAVSELFPAHPISKDTALIAILQPSDPVQKLHLIAAASIGIGREHARFSPVSQCSYEYSLDSDEERIEAMFTSWLNVSKKVSGIDKESERYLQLKREFETMQIKRCYLMDEKMQPYSFDFIIETTGALTVEKIVARACDVGENMCSKFVNINTGNLPDFITASPADARVVGFDFLIRGHDHTLGNLLQTWLVEHHIEGTAEPRITYAGYSVPHPLRDEIILRIGLDGAKLDVAKRAIANAARGCLTMFQELRAAWVKANGKEIKRNVLRAVAKTFVPGQTVKVTKKQ